MDADAKREIIDNLLNLPDFMNQALSLDGVINKISQQLMKASSALFLGPRDAVSYRYGGRVEVERNQLYSCRGLCQWRAETRTQSRWLMNACRLWFSRPRMLCLTKR